MEGHDRVRMLDRLIDLAVASIVAPDQTMKYGHSAEFVALQDDWFALTGKHWTDSLPPSQSEFTSLLDDLGLIEPSPPPPPPASHGRLQYLDKVIHAHMTRDVVPGQTIEDGHSAVLDALLTEWFEWTGEHWVNSPARPKPPRGPSKATAKKAKDKYDTSQPDILDRIKALLLRFIDWLNGHTGAAEDDKHIADGEHMATFEELFDD